MSSSYAQHQNNNKNGESKSKIKLKSKAKTKDKEDKNNNYISYQNGKTKTRPKVKSKSKHKEDNYITYPNNSKTGGGGGGGGRGKGGSLDSGPKKKKNIFDLCKMVENYIYHNCQKHKISPADLYEELHYQLPEEWIQGLRFIIRNSERQQLKIDYDISQTDSNTSSEI